MAVSLLANDVSDLCIGKPVVRSLPLSAAAGDLAATVRKGPHAAAASCIAIGPARASSRDAPASPTSSASPAPPPTRSRQ
ncbi:CBS domain-containing protein CBSX5-like [Hordeum vulgare]|nr:CBS domain-containing protein CBSX5-like [Hordeum vulgare]